MALIVMPSLLSKRPWARIRARCEASFFIVLSKSVRCCSVRGRTYLTLIALKIGVTCHIALELSREILYQKTFGRALIGKADTELKCNGRGTSLTTANQVFFAGWVASYALKVQPVLIDKMPRRGRG